MQKSCHDVIWGDMGDTPIAEQYPKSSLPLGLRSTLTALLAFGALLDHEMTDSEMLYHAARSCYLDIVDGASLESVQLALQLAVFEMNSRRASSASSTLAVAIRIVHSLVRSNVLLGPVWQASAYRSPFFIDPEFTS
jgi:hypothetical protein